MPARRCTLAGTTKSVLFFTVMVTGSKEELNTSEL
jgi:hypothetical protein